MNRESIQYDVVIVGAGPAGLSAAIALKQHARAAGVEIGVCVLEKGSEVGAHILSGAVLEPAALDELWPGWREAGPPAFTPVSEDRMWFLTERRALRLPMPFGLHNRGNYIISLSRMCRWLAERATALGVEIFPGFAAADVIRGEDGRIEGIITGDMGRNRQGEPKPGFQPGMEIRATYTLLAEGCRGSLSEPVIAAFGLREGKAPQTYGLGIKEVWEIDPAKHRPGHVSHSVGWPLDRATYGGSFLYHWEAPYVSLGLVAGLDYHNPWFDPYQEFQRWKTHPQVRRLLEGGRRIAYGARALNEGGFQSIPRLVFPGGMLVGCAAGFVNVPKIKGIHNAMRSGMAAAQAIVAHWAEKPPVLTAYQTAMEGSPVFRELRACRNVRPAFARFGLFGGLACAGAELLLKGRVPWTLGHRPDHQSLDTVAEARPIAYPAPDNVLTFDRMSSVYLSATNHEEDQPCHLKLRDPAVAIHHNLRLYDAPEQRYCPAGVYEIVGGGEGGEPRLQINAQNCVHCKTCDIKDPTQNIRWVTPEGGGGPNYTMT